MKESKDNTAIEPMPVYGLSQIKDEFIGLPGSKDRAEYESKILKKYRYEGIPGSVDEILGLLK